MRWLAALLLCLLTQLAVASPGGAEESTASQAKKLFSFGVRAYEAGQYRAALTAFEKAYALSPQPPILFSCAQALRRQWALDHRVDDLQRAIGYYRRYVEVVKEGGRRAEAAAALEELEPLAAKLTGAPVPEPGTPEAQPRPEAAPAHGLIMVSSSVKKAKATLDGKPVSMPLAEQVPPGKHVVRISARGYVTWEREVQIAAGGTFADDAVLVARKASLSISGSDGADVLLDGRPVGEMPLLAPIETPAGRRRVAVVRDGYKPYVADVILVRGEKRELDVTLSPTGQRIASYVLFGAGLAGLVAGSALAGVSFSAQSTAQKIDEKRERENITEAERLDYQDAVVRRDEYRRFAAVGLGAGALLGAVGFVLFIADSPDVEAAAPAPDASVKLGASGADLGLSLHLAL
jgi:hypothetical protein